MGSMDCSHFQQTDLFFQPYPFLCRANSTYEGVYLLGTSIARPLIAKRQIEIAMEVGG